MYYLEDDHEHISAGERSSLPPPISRADEEAERLGWLFCIAIIMAAAWLTIDSVLTGASFLR